MRLQINSDLCTGCGLCDDVCPSHIPEVIVAQNQRISIISEKRAALCMECAHCVAICPTQAIRLKSFDANDFKLIKSHGIDEEQMLALLQQRRSIRRYKKLPVPRATIEKIIMAAHAAPTGSGSMTTGVIALDNPYTLAELSGYLYQAYQKLDKALRNPIARLMIRRKEGKQIFNMLQNFVMPGMRWYISWYKEGRSNEILAEEALSKDYIYTARLLFHQAAGCYHVGQHFFYIDPEQKNRALERVWGNYQKAIALYGKDQRSIRIDIPFRGTKIPGYLRLQKDTKKSLMILINGMDNLKETEMQYLGKLLSDAGFNTFAFDGSGQGEM